MAPCTLDEQARETSLGGCIQELTTTGGPTSSLVEGHAEFSISKTQTPRPALNSKQARGTVPGGHI